MDILFNKVTHALECVRTAAQRIMEHKTRMDAYRAMSWEELKGLYETYRPTKSYALFDDYYNNTLQRKSAFYNFCTKTAEQADEFYENHPWKRAEAVLSAMYQIDARRTADWHWERNQAFVGKVQ